MQRDSKEPNNSITFISGEDGAGKAESKVQFLNKIPGFLLPAGNTALFVVGSSVLLKPFSAETPAEKTL